VDAEIIEIDGYCGLRMEYARGAPKKLAAAGAIWGKRERLWIFPQSQRAAVEKLLPALKVLAVKQRERDASEVSDYALEDMSDSGMTSRLGQTADEVRREMVRA